MTAIMANTKTDGERLRDYIELNLINQSELCRAMNIGRSTLFRMMQDATVIPGRKKQIADFLGIKITDIWPVGIPIEATNDVDADTVAMLQRALGEALGRIENVEGRQEEIDKRVRSLEAERLKRGGGKGLKFRT